jgi:hypothetical protein
MTSKTREELGDLTPEQIAELNRLAEMPDSGIDTSDIPEITEIPTHAVRGEAARREMVRRRRADGKLPRPVYLNAELEDYLAAIALRRGLSLNDLVNDLLAKEIAIVEAVK